MKPMIAACLFLLFLSACQPRAVLKESASKAPLNVMGTMPAGSDLYRFIDEEAHVVCWVVVDVIVLPSSPTIGGVGKGVGLSCIPLQDTNLYKFDNLGN